MRFSPKPLHEQVIFITGATSRVGLALVQQAIRSGASVFMVDGNEDALQLLQDDLRNKELKSAYAVADIRERDQLQFAVDQCMNTFGRIDTFINNSYTSIKEHVMNLNIEEARKIFEINFWSMVNGCSIAVPVMKKKGGVLINADVLPDYGMNSVSKQALKTYTDILRRELMKENISMEVLIVSPSSREAPVAAANILRCAENLGTITNNHIVKKDNLAGGALAGVVGLLFASKWKRSLFR